MQIKGDEFLLEGDESFSRDRGRPSQGGDSSSFELTPELRAELLDPERWGKVLELYARTTRLAVALIDPEGQLVGICHNPQPIWSLARDARPEWGGGCLFCLEPKGRCTAVADALRTNSLVLVHDQAGFAHVASPLLLGGRHLGTLIAGQVFNQYPEPLPLEQVARKFGFSAQQLWYVARQQAPINRANLTVYGNLLSTLGQAFLRDRYGAVLENRLAETNKKLQSFNEELETVNSELNRKVAELNRSKDLLRSLNQDLKHFSYAASHDLQEPLRMVMSYTQLLAQRYKGRLDQRADEFIAFAVEGAQRMERLLRDLREYWSVSEQKVERSMPLDCDRVLGKAVGILEIAIRESGASVTHDPLPTIMAEEVPLTMLFQNLLGNAIKYRRPGEPPRIHVSARKNANVWCFSVRDNGIGIEDKYLETIFAPFKRLHGRDYPGSGIGLAICSKIVERHGGRLWVESLYGQGSTFHFTIPEAVAQ